MVLCDSIISKRVAQIYRDSTDEENSFFIVSKYRPQQTAFDMMSRIVQGCHSSVANQALGWLCPSAFQGYIAHKRPPPRRTLQ